jgi:hypothetical protein
LIFVLLFAGCSNQEKIDKEKEALPTQIGNEKSRSDENVVTENKRFGYITADKVRIRESATTDSQVLDELNIWSEVSILGKSDNKQKIGEYDDYWYKIGYDGKVGWCYGALLLDTNDANDNVEQLKECFNSQEIKYKQAVNILKAIGIITKDTDFIDEGIVKISSLQKKYGNNLCQNLFSDIERVTYWQYSNSELNDISRIKEEDLKAAIIKAKDEGFKVEVLEGDLYLEPLPKYLIEIYGDYLSEHAKEYLNLKNFEIESRMADEGFLLITWDELADRIVCWEKFITKYPDSKEAQQALNEFFAPYLYFYINGMDNTQVYDSVTGILSDEVKTSYRYFINEYEGSESQKVILELYNMLEENDFKKNENITTYIEDLF